MNSQQGYYRFPTVYNDRLAFVSEDDLWEAPLSGGVARRLTANNALISHPKFSPDGKWIAFTGRDEGLTEIYAMPSSGGAAKRLTYFGSMCHTVGWQNGKIVFCTTYGVPFLAMMELYTVDPETGETVKLPYGPAIDISFNGKKTVLARSNADPARWKRYRGGRVGHFWVDNTGDGNYTLLESLKGNIASPMWIDDRIYFISDESGFGNLHSCAPDGTGVKQHTKHNEYYARYANTDLKTIVYHYGADIYSLDIKSNESKKIKIDYQSPQIHIRAKFVPSVKHLESYALNQDGGALAVTARGKAFTFANWEGAVKQYGKKQGVRYKYAEWTPDGEKVVVVSDEGGEERFEIYPAKTDDPPEILDGLKINRVAGFKISPDGKMIALTNNAHELIVIDVEKKSMKKIDQSKFSPLHGFDWSADSRWIAYSIHLTHQNCVIRICSVETGKISGVTEPILHDFRPVFDPKGRYLYFLSARVFNPVYDNMHFDYNFPRGERPYLITLRKDVASPFVPEPKGFGAQNNSAKKDEEKKEDKDNEEKSGEEKKEPEVEPVEIDFDGINERVVAFPVAEGLYGDIQAIDDRVFYTFYNIQGTLDRNWADPTPQAKATLKVYEFAKLEESVCMSGITSFGLSQNGSALAYRQKYKLRIVEAKRDPKMELPKEATPSRKTGWINLDRIKVAIEPREEWKQMYCEAWRLQRDYFWVENMSGVDWKKVYERYLPLIDRIGTRAEFSDLLWEMQGELGTSHAYEMGGDYKPHPIYQIGFLGAELEYVKDKDAYRFKRIGAGDVWEKDAPPPLKRPGINIHEGMLLLKVGNEKVNRTHSPYKAAMNYAGEEIDLEIADADGSNARTVTVRTIKNEIDIWYRDWVEKNRSYVHEQTDGKVGYVHIPNMGPIGYAEFHRYFLAEYDYDGLIIDVRYNGGGHVSPLLLEKLNRKRIGYSVTRWMGFSEKPQNAPKGPIVALTNESAGSDGDIFSHGFKLMKLGKLIGTRTWGGVVGIMPRNALVDGTLTTQPEFSNWFIDVRYGVENYGTDPDIVVHNAPHDYAADNDPQLERALVEIKKELKENPPETPDFEEGKPVLRLPG